MKKLLVVALSVMMLFSFASCNNSTPADLEVGIVADYFGAFATNHIFNQVDLELGENTDSDEISGLTTTYTPAVEAQPAKITATCSASTPKRLIRKGSHACFPGPPFTDFRLMVCMGGEERWTTCKWEVSASRTIGNSTPMASITKTAIRYSTLRPCRGKGTTLKAHSN